MRATLEETALVFDALEPFTARGSVRLDFSVVSDMNYYNGLIFQGFVRGIPSGILSGGQYDLLAQKMGKKARAVGFAVYLDELELLDDGGAPENRDAILLYDELSSPREVLVAAERLAAEGLRVQPLRELPPQGAGAVYILREGRLVRD